jgi:ferredoxin like protein
MNRMSVLEKLAANKYDLDEGNPHIEVDQEVCREVCHEQACLFVCPASVYSLRDDVIFADWAGCLECGTCKVTCPPQALHWVYPRGGFGVIYRQG